MRSSRILFGLVLALLSSPLSAFAQGQQPTELIDFEDFSGPNIATTVSPPLQVLSATFSGGEILTGETFLPADLTSVYYTSYFCDGCLPTITIDFNQKVSNFSTLLLNGRTITVTYTIEDDQGGQQQITLVANFGSGAGTITLPDNNIRQVVISGDADEWDFSVDNVQFSPSGPVLLDPVDSGFVIGGPQVTTNPAILSQGGVIVQGVAADGATQAVVRIPANYPGESLSVTVYDENGTTGNVANNGGLFAPGGSPQSAASTLPVTAVGTSNGPMAFVIYLSPVNFARSSQDYTAATRTITLQVQSNNNPNYILTANATILRPPVVLVHGLWGEPGDWSGFTPLVNDSRFFVKPVDYNDPVPGVIGSDPLYLTLNVRKSAVGFSYNSSFVDKRIRKLIADFKHSKNVAAVQADVVAHSMGGDVVRTAALSSAFTSNDTYAHGPIDKLITIGTPHLGTPLATDLVQDDANACLRFALSLVGKMSFRSVLTNSGSISGGVADLQGDGSGGGLSPALQALHYAPPIPFAMARVSATENSNNLNGLQRDFTWASAVAYACGLIAGEPLAIALTPTGWPGIFFGQANDAVVPLNSQLNGGSLGVTADGVIHSWGLEKLGFYGPIELVSDPANSIPTGVINLLNERLDGPDYQ